MQERADKQTGRLTCKREQTNKRSGQNKTGGLEDRRPQQTTNHHTNHYADNSYLVIGF